VTLPTQVPERPPRLAGIDRDIRLDKRWELAIRTNVAALGRDDSRRDRSLQSKWAAYRKHPVTHLHAVGVAKFSDGKRMVDVNLDHREVGFLIGANDLCVMLDPLWLILQMHANAVGLLDDVPVGKNESFGIDDYSRTQ